MHTEPAGNATKNRDYNKATGYNNAAYLAIDWDARFRNVPLSVGHLFQETFLLSGYSTDIEVKFTSQMKIHTHHFPRLKYLKVQFMKSVLQVA